jgi:hypothetical protein
VIASHPVKLGTIHSCGRVSYVPFRQIFFNQPSNRSNSYAAIVEKPLRDETMWSSKMALPYLYLLYLSLMTCPMGVPDPKMATLGRARD